MAQANGKPKAYAYVMPDQTLPTTKGVQVEAFDKIRLKTQARKRRRLTILRNVSLFVIFVAIYLNSPLANVKKITVLGNTNVPSQTIMDEAGVTLDQHFYWLDVNEIAQKITDNPLVDKVQVKRKLGNRVELIVTEAQVMGVTQTDNGKMWILSSGEQVAVQNDVHLNVPYFRNWDAEKGELYFSNLAKIPADVQRQISEVAFDGTETDAEQLQLYMRDGNQVTISVRQIPDKLTHYFSIVEVLGNKRMHIHLEAGNYATPL